MLNWIKNQLQTSNLLDNNLIFLYCMYFDMNSPVLRIASFHSPSFRRFVYPWHIYLWSEEVSHCQSGTEQWLNIEHETFLWIFCMQQENGLVSSYYFMWRKNYDHPLISIFKFRKKKYDYPLISAFKSVNKWQ